MRKFKTKPTGRPRLPRIVVDVKRCVTCKTMKIASDFYRQSSSRDGLTCDCKACRNLRVKKYREANAQSISKRRKAKYQENPEKYIVRTLRWQEKNPDKMAIKAKRYGQKDSAKLAKRIYRQTRIVRLKNALVKDSALVTAEWFSKVIARQGNACIYCGKIGELEMEHVEPISRGGLHVRENIVAACQACNCSKGAKLLLEWRMGR